MQEKRRTLHTLCGRSGSGKTTLLRQILNRTDRALVYDIIGNYEPGVIFDNQADILDYLSHDPPRFRIVYRPAIDISQREQVFDAADWLCELSRAVGPVDLFMDEIDTFCDHTELPEQLDFLIRYGRNIEVTLRGAVRRPKAVIPKHYITETTRFSIFRCVDPNDTKYLEQYTGIQAEQISSLEELEFYDWNDGHFAKYKLTHTPEDDLISLTDSIR